MKVLLSWLRDFAPFEGDPVELGEQLSDLGMAVESMERVGEGLEDVVVARVLDLRAHPDADRVQLVDVDPGTGDAIQVVCGAFNMKIGDLVPLARIGATLPNGAEIGRRKVRGQASEGMLCSPIELRLGDDAGGILILPASSAEPGSPLAEALGIDVDVLYDLEINPNRPDAMSVAGVARDLAARLGLSFRLPEPRFEESPTDAAKLATVEIVDTDLCGRFLARVLQNVTIQPSPAAIANRLTLAGMRPINNVVDASNYVMLELGQPNHPYDLARLPGRGLRVRRAKPGETLVTLDEVERTFGPDDLLICDAEDNPVGIAGIMGGASAEIDERTTEVLLELAWFDRMTVARTSKRLGLRTEASARFERGCDWTVVELAATRFSDLLAGSPTTAAGQVDQRGELPDRLPVQLRTARVNALLGTELSDDDVRRYLDPIGFTTKPIEPGLRDVALPSWRLDSTEEIDLVEEVARHHGYSRIPRTVPQSARAGGLDPYQRERRRLRDVLLGLGACEAMPLPFLAPDDLEQAGFPTDGVRVANPLAADESVLRPSLLPGLLKALAHNAAHRNPDVDLFELGHVFGRPRPGESLPDEREVVAVAHGGRDATAAKATWDVVAEALGVDNAALVADDRVAGLHPTRTARILRGERQVGVVGEVDPEVLEAYDVPGRVGWLELDLTELGLPARTERPYRPVSRYPSSDVDLAFVVDESTPAAAVERTLREAGGELLVDLRLFEVYRGEQVGEGRRSLNYSLRFQAPDRTLTDEEVAAARQRCIEAVESSHPARLRGN